MKNNKYKFSDFEPGIAYFLVFLIPLISLAYNAKELALISFLSGFLLFFKMEIDQRNFIKKRKEILGIKRKDTEIKEKGLFLIKKNIVLPTFDTEIKKEDLPNHEKYRVARKIDWDSVNKNKSLVGKKGEEIVYLLEKEYLMSINKHNLAEKVKNISKEYGDGLGYDILSFFENGEEKFIEVKSTSLKNSNSFLLSKNELEFLREKQNNAFIYNVIISGQEEPELETISAIDLFNKMEIIPSNYKVYFK